MLPTDFCVQMQTLLPDYAAFEAALKQAPPTAIRLQPLKVTTSLPAMPWCPSGHYLPQRPSFTLDPRFHAGAYYVQDPSCMVLEALLTHLGLQPQRILDACAAPGGKTTHLASLYPQSLIVANDVIQSRAQILAENVSKWGSSNIIVSQQDPNKLSHLHDFFDLILVDAPCSGEGLFRKDPKAWQEWSLKQVKLCSRRQTRILTDLWPALAPGGVLVYATCTYNLSENQGQLGHLLTLGAEKLSWELPETWGLKQWDFQGHHCLQCLPHLFEGEGFFLSAVRKPDSALKKPYKLAKTTDLLSPKQTVPFSKWLAGDWLFQARQDQIWAWPQAWEAELAYLHKQLHILQAPVVLAQQKGKIFQPSPELANNTALNAQLWPQVQLSAEQALSYLQGEALYDLEAEHGLNLVCTPGLNLNLGWIKQAPGRANNLYPRSRRIRMRPDASHFQMAWQTLQDILPLQAHD